MSSLKMKFILLWLLAGFAEYTTANWSDEIESIGMFQAFAINFVADVHCPEPAAQKLKEEQEKAIECVKGIRSNSSFCDTFVHHFKPCVQGILQESERCVDPYEMAFKNALLDSVIEEARYICGIDGEHILEILNPCIARSVRQSKGCRKNITKTVNLHRNIEAICRVLPSLQKCFEDKMQDECENDITKTTIHDFLSADAKPCNIVTQLFFEIL